MQRRKSKLIGKESIERLKERFKAGGLEGFSQTEIIELLLSFVLTEKELKAASSRLVREFKSLNGVFLADPAELAFIKGMSKETAALIGLIKDISHGYIKERPLPLKTIRGKNDVLKLVRPVVLGENTESFLAVYLNSRNEVLSTEIIHKGPPLRVSALSRKAVELAFRHNARSVIFVRSLLERDPSPTFAERQLAKILERAALAVDLLVHEHLIMGSHGHFSGREKGWIGGASVHIGRAAEDDFS